MTGEEILTAAILLSGRRRYTGGSKKIGAVRWLAQELGYNQTTVNGWIAERHKPEPSVIAAIQLMLKERRSVITRYEREEELTYSS